MNHEIPKVSGSMPSQVMCPCMSMPYMGKKNNMQERTSINTDRTPDEVLMETVECDNKDHPQLLTWTSIV